MSDPTELLEQMNTRSTLKLNLPKNLAKPSWRGMTDEQVKAAVLAEIRELLEAMRHGTWDQIADEAGDVYHWASMGADPKRNSGT